MSNLTHKAGKRDNQKTEQAKDDAQSRLDALVQGIAQVRGSKDGTDKERLLQRRSEFLTSMGLMS